MGLLLPFVAAIILFLVGSKLWCFWNKSKVCLVGKTALITGAASGIGFQIALDFASKGCRVIIADIANLSKAVEEVKKRSYNPNIVGVSVDLQSLNSVRQLAKHIIASESRLDILMCNAGIPDCKESVLTEDGLDRTMQVNYFSHFLLTHLLLDLLKKSAPSRVVFTSSLLGYFSNVQVDKLNPSSNYFKLFWSRFIGATYSNSKLCMAGAAAVFGKKLKGTGVTVNAVHPGAVWTPIYGKAFLSRNYAALSLIWYVYLAGKTSEEGAQTLTHVAYSDDVKNITGQMFMEGIRFPRPGKLTAEFCEKLWELSIEFTKLQSDEIKC